ncbi:MAG TPA: protoglobin domain-containing protein [Kofleriaceae bacterium]|nr:protoglobin domain-containing protein [Kofleriaceae bacterium]
MTYLEELIAYIALDRDDEARLRSLHPILEPHFRAIADRFYEAVWQNPGAASVLSGPAQVERLRVTLIEWMSSGLLGPYDERFYEKRSRIGRRHVAIGLRHQYMFTAMNVMRSAYSDVIAEHVPAQAITLMRSVNKLLDIELAIAMRHYQLDSEDKLIARERRVQADRMTAMQTMTAGIAHEVRNPLNAAKLQLELLDRRIRRQGIDAKILEPCTLAQNEIARLTMLLNDFLSFARPPALNSDDVDVTNIVRQVVELEHGTASQKRVELTLAPPPRSVLAHVDAPKLHQLLLNLVRNAIEAVQPGGHVHVAVAGGESDVTFTITDDGPGIPAEIRTRIYEPFFSTKEGGTGLGMSIVHSLVSQHGGTIGLDTSARGTTFTIRIPRRA